MDPDTTRVIHRDLNRAYPTVVRGEGIYLYDDAGKRYIDGSGGSAAVTAIGHGVPEIVDAITRQAATLAYAPTHAFTTDAIEDCAKYLVEHFAPDGMDRVWFVSGGSEATENAVKMALQYHRDRGEGTRHLIVSRWGSYHGSTIGALGYTGNTGRRRKYVSAIPHGDHIPPCNPYRCWVNGSCATVGCDLSCADYLDRTIRQLGAENVAAFIAEPVVGATLGAMPASDGYFQRIRETCDRHGILFIADEVMTGFGRCGTNFAIEQWGVTPDLIACAKGISGGYAPLGAVIAKSGIVGDVRQRGQSFVIGHTSAGNPLSCATGHAVMKYIVEHDLVQNAATVGPYFLDRLAELKDRHAMIGDVRGRGLLAGIEFVLNRDSKEPLPSSVGFSKRLAAETMERGLISYPLNGTVDGTLGDHFLYAPPLTITRPQIDDIVTILNESLSAVAKEMGASR